MNGITLISTHNLHPQWKGADASRTRWHGLRPDWNSRDHLAGRFDLLLHPPRLTRQRDLIDDAGHRSAGILFEGVRNVPGPADTGRLKTPDRCQKERGLAKHAGWVKAILKNLTKGANDG